MRGRRFARLASAMALALVTQLGGSQPSAAQSDRVPLGASAVDWTPLGALGPQGPRTLAVFPTWPANPTIVAERGADVILTRDGGQTLGAARWGTSSWLAHRTRLSSWVRTNDGQGYRSADLGQTWELTFDVRCTQDLAVSEPPRCDNPPQYGAPAVGPDIQVSPGFARDGTAYLSADGRLWRSRDAARNWQPLDPAPGQLVQSYQLSPDYGDDATVVAAVAGGGFFQTSLAPDAFPSSDPADSSGVLVSTDGGDTWTQLLSSGLAVDDQPYLAVQRIFPSPAYPKDGTMFAFALGDPSQSRPFGTPVAAMKRALFRSVDGGASWDVVAVDGPLPFPTVQQLAFSPDFAHDGVMLWARNDKPSSPASGSCQLRRSSDRGLTWTSVLKTTFQYSYCQDPGFSSVQGKTLAHVSVTAREQWSDHAGQTWVPFQLGPYLAGLVSSAPTAARSGSILVGFRPRDGSGGLFALGTGLPPSNGALPCAQPIVAGFARVFQQDAHLRNWLGCPLAPEHNTPIRVWHDHPASGDLTPLAGRRLAELRRPHSRCIPRER